MKSGIVKAYASSQAGRAKLTLKNETDSPLKITAIAAGIDGSNTSVMLLPESIELPKDGGGNVRVVDVTEGLLKLFTQPQSEQQATIFVRLHITPSPVSQPQPGTYSVRLVNGSFVEFGAA
jgi:hypothetical protein